MTSSKKKDNCHENCFLTASMDTDETSTPYQIGVARRAPFDDITNTLPAPCTNTGQHVTVRKRQRQCQSRIMSGSKDEIGDQNEPPVEALTAAVAAIEMMTNPEAVPTALDTCTPTRGELGNAITQSTCQAPPQLKAADWDSRCRLGRRSCIVSTEVTPSSTIDKSTPKSISSACTFRATPCSRVSTRPASASVWGSYDEHGSTAAAHHGVQASEVLFFRFLEVEAPDLNGEREAHCFDLEVPTMKQGPLQGAMLYYDDVEGDTPSKRKHRVQMFARLLFVYKLQSEPDTVWIEHMYLYDEEDILTDRRGFGSAYLRRKPLLSSQELIGTPYRYHSCATAIVDTFNLQQDEAHCKHESCGSSGESDGAIFFCSRYWNPYTGRSVHAPVL